MRPLSWKEKIPRTRLYLTNREIAGALWNVGGAAGRRWECVDEFERAFAVRWGVEDAVAGPYARVCFHQIIKELGLPPGGEIVTTPLNIHDMVSMIVCAGHRPVFVDIDPATYQMDVSALRAAITPRTRAVLVTHLFGLASDMDGILAVCRDHGIVCIEDASHSFGTTLHGLPMGTFGEAGFFSLSSLKSVSSGCGGVVVAKNAAITARVRSDFSQYPPPRPGDLRQILLKNLIVGIATQGHVFGSFTFPLIRMLNTLDPAIVSRLQSDNPISELISELPSCWQRRFGPIQARLAMRCLERLDAQNGRRRVNAALLLDGLRSCAPERLPRLIPDSSGVFWRFPFRAPEGNAFARFMNRRGVDVATTLMPCCSESPSFQSYASPTPHASAVVKEVYFLPVEHGLNERQIGVMVESVRAFVRAGA